MFKKLAFTGIAATVVAFLLFGTAVFTNISEGVGWVRGQVEENVPIEYKLEKARKAIKSAEPRIREYNRDIAEKQVEIRYLERELGQLRHEAAQARLTLEKQFQMLQVEKASYRFLSRTVSQKQMRRDAALRLRRLKAADDLIASKNARLDALRNGLSHIHEALANLIQTREELVTQCDVLEAKLRETEARKASTLDIEVDHSDMARAAEILSRVEKQLDVEMQVMENNRPLLGESRSVLETPEDLNAQISAYLNGDNKEVEETEVVEAPVQTTSLVELR